MRKEKTNRAKALKSTSTAASQSSARGHSKSEQALREYQEILAAAEEVAKVGSWNWDLRSQEVTWSDEMFRLFGVERQGSDVDMDKVIAERIHPEDAAAVRAANRKALEEAAPEPMSYRILLPNGTQRTVWAQGKLVRDEQGKPRALMGFVQDVTERVQAERSVLQLKRLYATLSQVNQMIVRVRDRQELFQTICDVAVQFGELSLAWIGLLDETSGGVRPVASAGLDIQRLPLSPIISMDQHRDSLLATALRTSRVVTTENMLSDPRISNMNGRRQSYPYRAAALIPFRLHGKPMGVLVLLSTETGIFADEDEVRLLEEMGLDISFALGNMENDRQRRQAEDGLRLSEEKFHKAFKSSPIALMITRLADGKYMELNNAYSVIVGYERDELIGRKTTDFNIYIHPGDHQAIVQQLLASGSVRDFETSIRHRSGAVRNIVAGQELLTFNGEACILSSLLDITERKQAEENLRQSEERYRLISENSADVIWVMDPLTNSFKYVSPSVQKLRGYTPAEVMAQPVTDALTPESLEKVSTLLKINLPKFLAQGAGTLTDVNEVDQPCKDGSIVHTEVTTTFTFNPRGQVEIVGISRNITERKLAEQKLHARSRQLAALLDASQSLTESLNLADVLQKITDKSAEVLDLETTAIYLAEDNQLYMGATTPPIRPDFPEIMRRSHIADHPHIAAAISTLQPVYVTDARTAELTAVERNISDALGLRTIVYLPLIDRRDAIGVLILGTISRPRELSANEVDLARALSNQAVLAIANAKLYKNLAQYVTKLESEIIERQRVQDQLRLLNLELEQRVHERTMELSHANRAKDEFLANMSHELRTPLNTVLGLSESLLEQRRGPLNEKQVQSIELIASSGQHLLGLINDILDVSKIEAGKLELHPTRVYVRDLCVSSMNFVKELALKKRISVECSIDESIHTFQADPQRLKQILINLLTNAVKFTPERGNVWLQVNTNEDRDQILFSVADTGIGIAADDLRKLFTPFVQLDSSLARQYSGTGLGLALVQKLTELHGGSVHVESEAGRGSRFTVVLPLYGAEDQEPDKPSLSTTNLKQGCSTAAIQASEPHRVVLLAEDNRTNAHMMSEYLEAQGYRVIPAQNGEEVLEKIPQALPDIILMDVQMPKLDGLETTRRLRSDPRFASTPIIALTALAMPGDKERCLEAGVNEYLSKPVSLKKLEEIIVRLTA